MSQIGPAGFFLTGTRLSLQIVRNDTGANVVLDGSRTGFDCNPKDTLLTSEPIDNGGRVVNKRIPGGWTGSIDVDRGTADFAKLVAFLDANFYNGGDDVYFTITTTEPAVDGSGDTTFQHTLVVFHNYKPGKWAKNEILKASVEFACSERLVV